MPELEQNAPHDLPKNLRLFTHQIGSIMGEEDLFNETNQKYSGTLKCQSQRGKVFKISREHLMCIKQQPESYLMLINQIIKKDKRKHGEFVSNPG